jgi:type II secretory pathway component PulK
MNRRGVVLIVVLWIVALLSVVMYSALFASRSDYALAAAAEREEKLKHVALSGIEYALAELLADSTPYDTTSESWFKNDGYKEVLVGEGGFALIKPSLGGGSTIEFGILDEASRVNVNTAAPEFLQRLDSVTPAIAQSIVDWRDEDSNPLPEGAEESYYSPLGYSCKNKPFETLEELLLVREMTPSVLFGKDRNRNGIVETSESTDATATSDRGIYPWVTCWSWDRNVTKEGAPRVNLNTANESVLRQALGDVLSRQQIDMIVNYRHANGKFSSVADLLNIPTIQKGQVKALVDRLTVTDEEVLRGLVNINTAPEGVLKIFGLSGESIDKVLQKRSESGTDLSTIGWVLDADEGLFRAGANFMTVRSRHFRVDVCARLTDQPLFRRYLAVLEIDREKKKAKILYFQDISHLRVNPW